MDKYKIEIKWAVIFALATMLWTGIERLLGWHDELIEQHQYLTNIFGIVAIVLYVFALIDKRNNFYNGIMSWKQGFIAGCIISLIIAILTPLTMFITMNFITPDYFTNMADYSIETGFYETREEATAYFSLSNYILQSTIFAFIIGVVTSAVVAFFVRRKPSPNAV